jgi:hypothetical protein
MTPRTLTAAMLTLAGMAVQAHEGHGMPGSSHWHVTDALVLVGALAVAAAGLWWSRRK